MAIGATRRSAVTLATAGVFAFVGSLYLGVRNLLAGQADRAVRRSPRLGIFHRVLTVYTVPTTPKFSLFTAGRMSICS